MLHIHMFPFLPHGPLLACLCTGTVFKRSYDVINYHRFVKELKRASKIEKCGNQN